MNHNSDRAWFLEEVRQNQARLRGFIRSLGVRAAAVDDFAQDALVIAWKKRNDFDREGSFLHWVREIARKLIANERRKETRRHEILSEKVTDYLLQVDAQDVHPALEQPASDSLAALQTCLAELAPEHRELLHQRYFEGLSPGAIASRLERTSNQVRQALFRLRKSLLACVERRLNLSQT